MEFFLRQVYPWLIHVASFSILLPFFVGLVLLRKQHSAQFKWLLLFVIFGVLGETIGQVTLRIGGSNNAWYSHLLTPLQFGAIAGVYYTCFGNSLIKKLIPLAVVTITVVTLYEAFILDRLNQLNSLSMILSHVVAILLALAYFYKVANDRAVLYLDRDPIFLFSCGLIIYYAGTSMSWALFNDALAVSYDAARVCISVVVILNIVFNTWQAFIFRRMAA